MTEERVKELDGYMHLTGTERELLDTLKETRAALSDLVDGTPWHDGWNRHIQKAEMILGRNT